MSSKKLVNFLSRHPAQLAAEIALVLVVGDIAAATCVQIPRGSFAVNALEQCFHLLSPPDVYYYSGNRGESQYFGVLILC